MKDIFILTPPTWVKGGEDAYPVRHLVRKADWEENGEDAEIYATISDSPEMQDLIDLAPGIVNAGAK